jgi:hypothetical protein
VNPDDVPSKDPKGDRIHVNIEDLEAAHRSQSAWSEPAQRKNRVRGNFIYGHQKDNPKRVPGYRGHMQYQTNEGRKVGLFMGVGKYKGSAQGVGLFGELDLQIL